MDRDDGARRSKKLIDQWWSVNLSTGSCVKFFHAPSRLLVWIFLGQTCLIRGAPWTKQTAGRSLVRPPEEGILSVALRRRYSNVLWYLPLSTLLRSAVLLPFMVVCHLIQSTKRKWKKGSKKEASKLNVLLSFLTNQTREYLVVLVISNQFIIQERK